MSFLNFLDKALHMVKQYSNSKHLEMELKEKIIITIIFNTSGI